MIYFLRSRANREQLSGMLEALELYIKLAVDVRQGVAAGGGVLHADCEAVLLEHGSVQEDIWGADWIPETQEVRYEALINIRPSQGNRSMSILNSSAREQVGGIVRKLLGGV